MVAILDSNAATLCTLYASTARECRRRVDAEQAAMQDMHSSVIHFNLAFLLEHEFTQPRARLGNA